MSPKHVTNFNNKCPITIIFGISVVSLCVIERWFHFPPHVSSATALPWEITEHKNDKFRRKEHIVLWAREDANSERWGCWTVELNVNRAGQLPFSWHRTVVWFHTGLWSDNGPARHWSSTQLELPHICTASHPSSADTRHYQDDHPQCCLIAAIDYVWVMFPRLLNIDIVYIISCLPRLPHTALAVFGKAKESIIISYLMLNIHSIKNSFITRCLFNFGWLSVWL